MKITTKSPKRVWKWSQKSPNLVPKSQICLCGAFLRKVPNSKSCIRAPVLGFLIVELWIPDDVDGFRKLLQICLFPWSALVLHHFPGEGYILPSPECIWTATVLEAADVITEDLRAFPLAHQVVWKKLELHDHVGKAGGDLLLQEVERALRRT